MTYFSEKKYKLAGMAWSSEMYYLDVEKKPFHGVEGKKEK